MASIIEITNPLTGAVERVDKLDHTAQEVDDGIAKAFQLSSPNLLDNWHFANPVDQRQGRIVKPNTTYYSDNTLATSAGTTSAYVTAYRYTTGTASGVSYASFKLEDTDTAPTYYAAPENVVRGYTGAGYGIDRWKFFNPGATLLIVDGGVRIIRPNSNVAWGTVVENYKRFAGKQVTLSFLTDNGLYSKSFMVPEVKPQGEVYPDYANAGTEIGHICIGIWDGLDGISVFFNSDGATVSEVTPIAAKLELGTQQTLAHQENGNWVPNEIPDYGQELAKCQRYFQLYSAAEKRPALAVDCRPTMRKDPVQGTIAIGGATYYYNNADL